VVSVVSNVAPKPVADMVMPPCVATGPPRRRYTKNTYRLFHGTCFLDNPTRAGQRRARDAGQARRKPIAYRSCEMATDHREKLAETLKALGLI